MTYDFIYSHITSYFSCFNANMLVAHTLWLQVDQCQIFNKQRLGAALISILG